MRKSSIGFLAVLATVMGLLSILRHRADGCAAVGPRGFGRGGIEINTETALIVWDAEHQVEHFIRKATFETAANHFGYLVPTPTKPELAEAKDAIFSTLVKITLPPRPKGQARIRRTAASGSCGTGNGHRARNKAGRRLRGGCAGSDRSKRSE